MEPIGAFFDEEWDSLNRMFSADQDFDFMVQSNNGHDESDDGLSFLMNSSDFWTNDHEANANMVGLVQSLFCSSDITLPNSNLNYISQEASNCTSNESLLANYNFYDSNYIPEGNYMSNFCPMDQNIETQVQVFGDEIVVEDIVSLNEAMEMGSERKLGDVGSSSTTLAAISDGDHEIMKLKRKLDMAEKENGEDDRTNTNTNTSKNPKKRSRVSRNATTKSKKNGQKKKQKPTANGNDEEESNGGPPNGQSSSCYNSEDDSNTSDSKGSAALNSSGNTRASRGSATDPQSLYARKRRERINERLRILQNLVPNGTKVDISTMLEEAVQYVKFLQLQIKLLSSDDMWMYAPIAYNGMDMGLYQKICPTL